MAKRTIGVLGGMGPAATVDFLAKLVAATPAARDQDHVPTIVYSVPQIPDRSSAILCDSSAPLRAMLVGLNVLERAGAEIVAIPCNSAHRWYDELSASTDLPILHIAKAVSERIPRGHDGPIALLATRGTILAGVYQRYLGSMGRTLVVPGEDDQCVVDAAIRRVKTGEDGASDAEEAVERLLDAGARMVILACTELPLALNGSSLREHCIDATEALAEGCVAASSYQPENRGQTASTSRPCPGET